MIFPVTTSIVTPIHKLETWEPQRQQDCLDHHKSYLAELLDGIIEVPHCVARLQVAAPDVAGSESSLSTWLDIWEEKPLTRITPTPGYTWHYLSIILILSGIYVEN